MNYAKNYDRFRIWASARWRILWLALAFIVCFAAFAIRDDIIKRGASEDPGKAPDSRMLGYRPPEVQQYFRAIQENGQHIYIGTQLTIDLVCPIVYGLLFCVVIARYCTIRFGRWWVLVPLLAVLCDYGENAMLIRLVCDSADPGDTVATTANCFTMTKWFLLLVVM